MGFNTILYAVVGCHTMFYGVMGSIYFVMGSHYKFYGVMGSIYFVMGSYYEFYGIMGSQEIGQLQQTEGG